MTSNPQDNLSKGLFASNQNANSNQQPRQSEEQKSPSFSNAVNSSGFSLFGNQSAGSNPMFSPFSPSPAKSEGPQIGKGISFIQKAGANMFGPPASDSSI